MLKDTNNISDHSIPQQDPSEYDPSNTDPAIGMKWFKFLIYFSLYASAFLSFSQGITYFRGTLYGSYADYFYRLYKGLDTLDICMGIACFIVGIFSIFVRFRLAGFYRNGPKLLTALYALGIIISLMYFISFQGLTPDMSEYFFLKPELTVQFPLPNIIANVILIIANKKYFDNRDYLFENY